MTIGSQYEFKHDYERWIREERDFENWARNAFILAAPTLKTLLEASSEYIAGLETAIRDLGELEGGHSREEDRAGVQDWFKHNRRSSLGST